ncbi:Rpp20 subunit of nuclear RNase MRP and P-domain-containing protein [Talaromyces proteolyticus]|uniref:Rpp20 subunit of nuclear RNase MRP and P-domain-containing protein n=1 Tax=Talaromyces proteolyticus TaxID=1131652 RepID=A0AAD4PTA0_9EURO|nr:Rpp20 subunit of nuclear RNase MRP and P-domain-containing protein [Talaromyces proteolyticus]KAH8692955.1 Rpp20 subunit of nuclear RNase MRP and P-domain-containing protein [Talaromyces proteolyticus]
MAPPTPSLNAANLSFEKKNTNLISIPHNYRVQKRPIPHAPVASPYAGTDVPKIVYVGSKTPFMSAIKRVQKLLRHAERRVMTPLIDEKERKRRHAQQRKRESKAASSGSGAEEQERKVLEECLKKLRLEKVLVKATGKAMEKAVRVGRWFEEKTEEYEVAVRTGSVCVVDDIVREEVEEEEEEDDTADDREEDDNTVTVDGKNEQSDKTKPTESKNQLRRRRKRERVRQQKVEASLDEDGEPPESRTRWVNMVEISVNLKS